MSSKLLSSRYLPLFALFALTVAYIGQVSFDVWRLYSPPKIELTYNEFIEPQPLSSQTAQVVSFGANEFLADWYWLQLIQYYGGGDPQGKYRKLPELFNMITDLSPKFSAAYQMGLLTLPGEGYVEEALRLGEKGKSNLPESWEVPYYTGLVHHIYKKDYRKAAELFERAAALPNSPENTKLFAAIYYKEAEERTTAYHIFKTIYDTADNEFAKERAKKYVEHLDVYFYLSDAVSTYRDRFGRYPGSLEALATSGVISGLPTSPLGVQFRLDPQTGQLSETK